MVGLNKLTALAEYLGLDRLWVQNANFDEAFLVAKATPGWDDPSGSGADPVVVNFH